MKNTWQRSVEFNEYSLACLDGKDVIKSKVSDHHPVVHDNVLFWNIMMKGDFRRGRYNNGFNIIENDAEYTARLQKVAYVIAEIVLSQPNIYAIGLCEGPIRKIDLKNFFGCLKQFPWMTRLTSSNGFYRPEIESKDHWGLLLLTDNHYKVNKISSSLLENFELFDVLANRFQIWELTAEKQGKKYLSLAHFPFSKDEQKTVKSELSTTGDKYCQLTASILKTYSEMFMVFCADFNINPFLITEYQHRYLDKIPANNSIISGSDLDFEIRSTTVDGILLSRQAKQNSYSFAPHTGLFSQLTRERGLLQKPNHEEAPRFPSYLGSTHRR